MTRMTFPFCVLAKSAGSISGYMFANCVKFRSASHYIWYILYTPRKNNLESSRPPSTVKRVFKSDTEVSQVKTRFSLDVRGATFLVCSGDPEAH